MDVPYRIVCFLTISTMAMWGVGCSKKTLTSNGETSRISQNASLNERSSTAPERIRPGVILAKSDPGATRRQMDDARAEQVKTAAAGLQDVYFGYDSWTISEEGRQALMKDAEWLRSHGMPYVRVEGHCDERGSSDYNLVLAEKRAKVVRNYLIELGLQSDRLAVVSYGKERPICTQHAESCYQQNRRGHLVLKP